jgi:hypothetical protein
MSQPSPDTDQKKGQQTSEDTAPEKTVDSPSSDASQQSDDIEDGPPAKRTRAALRKASLTSHSVGEAVSGRT